MNGVMSPWSRPLPVGSDLERIHTGATATGRTLSVRRLRWFFGLFAALFFIQAVHFVEHIAQFVQHYTLGVPREHAHGIIGQLDLETIHLLFGVFLMAALVAVYRLGADLFRRRGPVCLACFWALLLIEGYHVVEHVAKYGQHLFTGVQGTPGLFGNVFVNVLWFHFWINLVVTVLITVTFADVFRLRHLVRDARA